jgi:hypothetical protein
MVASMVRLMPILNSDGKITRLRVSVPRVDVLLDEPGGKYMLEENLPARAGQELRAHRAPSLKKLVRWAMECQSAEELGKKLRRRYQRRNSAGGSRPAAPTPPTRPSSIGCSDRIERGPYLRPKTNVWRAVTRPGSDVQAVIACLPLPPFAAGKHNGPRIAPSGAVIARRPELTNEATPMLAEKFILLMETLKSHASPDGAPRVVSTSPHVPVKLPAASNK